MSVTTDGPYEKMVLPAQPAARKPQETAKYKASAKETHEARSKANDQGQGGEQALCHLCKLLRLKKTKAKAPEPTLADRAADASL